MQFTLPDWAQHFLMTEAGSLTTRQLRPAQAQLTQNYRTPDSQEGLRLNSRAAREVYRRSRLPAIYAVVCRLGQEIQSRWPEYQPQTLLDLGAGPGTVPLALHSYLPSLHHLILLEQDHEQVRWGQALFAASGIPALQEARWHMRNLNTETSLPQADLVTLSYVLDELNSEYREQLSAKLLQHQAKMLLLIEPGTPRGYHNLLQIRQKALQTGWHIFGPCPHAAECPLENHPQNDWCHFAARSPRSQIQRQLKEAHEAYEDEKFCWLSLTRQPVTRTEERILRRPLYRKGVVDLTLCTPAGKQLEKSIAKSHPLYKQARKAHWGDTLSDKP